MMARRRALFKVPNATPLAERLRLRSEPAATGCIVWTGNKLPFGHGILGKGKKTLRVHRIAWELTNGSIPAGMCVCHKCDVPACINPDHLFLGTIADNNADMMAKGRNVAHPGERNGRAKLTVEQIAAIRNDPRKQWDIARDYGIRQGYVSRIKSGRLWRCVESEPADRRQLAPAAADAAVRR